MELRPGLLALEFRVVDPPELEPHHLLRRRELRRLLQDFLRLLPALELRESRPELVEYRRVGTLRRPLAAAGRFRSSRTRLPRSRRLMASWKNRAATRARVIRGRAAS